MPAAYLSHVHVTRRCPSLANSGVVERLGEADVAQLQQATQLAQLYILNKCTPNIWQAIISQVEAEGSLSGMLRKLTAPLMHNGYKLAKCRAACDWQVEAHVSSTGRLVRACSSCRTAYTPATQCSMVAATGCQWHQHARCCCRAWCACWRLTGS
jgi:hypothetical protein